MTYTYVVLSVSARCYNEIYSKLCQYGYGHALNGTVIDMHGIALEKEEEQMDSTSDRRVENNVMRHEYRVLSEAEKAQMKEIKDQGLAFVQFCDSLGQSRELSLAKTKAEEAVMWAVKHLTR